MRRTLRLMGRSFFVDLELEVLRVLSLVVSKRVLVRQVEREREEWSARSITFDFADRKAALRMVAKLAFSLGEEVLDVLPEGVRSQLSIFITHRFELDDDQSLTIAWDLSPAP